MHPAPSVIIFTTFSGFGFGLLAWLGFSFNAPTGLAAFLYFAAGFGFAVVGLLASTFHLGHPERAWRAFTQWKTSWLSREGICAVSALLVLAVYAVALIFFSRHLVWLGWFGGILSVMTVFTTSMIYTQLATVPRWNSPLTPVLFLSLSAAGGAFLMGQPVATLALVATSAIVQIIAWLYGDKAFAFRGSSLETATGLGDMGEMRAMAPPHSSPNYLMKEFIYIVGRKHAQKLRLISLTASTLVPFLLIAICPLNMALTALALACHLFGVVVGRWLFFAQAEHVVGLYYGMR